MWHSNKLIDLPPIMGRAITDQARALLDRVADMTILPVTPLAMACNSVIVLIKESGRGRVSQTWKAHRELLPSMKWYNSICERDKWDRPLNNSSLRPNNLTGSQREVFGRLRRILLKSGEIVIESESVKCICVNATERMLCMTVGTRKPASHPVEDPDWLHSIVTRINR